MIVSECAGFGSVDVINITPIMASEFLSYTFEGQRKVDPVIVSMYANDMATGKWGVSEGAIIIGVRGDRKYLIAGNHRINAVVKSGVTVPFLVQYRHYKSEGDMYFDYVKTNGGKRFTQGQKLEALSTADALGVSKQIVDTSAAAMKIIATSFEGRQKDRTTNGSPLQNGEVMHDLLMEWSVPIYAYNSAIAHAERSQYKWFLRSSVAAISIVTFRYCPVHAEKFWREVASNNGLERGTPQHALHSFLSTTNSPVGTTGVSDYCRKIARFWTLYRIGKPVKYAKTPENFTLFGTPWDGKLVVDGFAVLGIYTKKKEVLE